VPLRPKRPGIPGRFALPAAVPLTDRRCSGYLGCVPGGFVSKPLVLAGVLLYSILVAALRWLGVIGTTGTVVLFAVMVADLAATHWLLRRSRGP
jgi:hypothetical protein